MASTPNRATPRDPCRRAPWSRRPSATETNLCFDPIPLVFPHIRVYTERVQTQISRTRTPSRSDEGGEDSAPDPHHEEAAAPLPSAPGPADSGRQATAVLTARVKSRSGPVTCGHRKIPSAHAARLGHTHRVSASAGASRTKGSTIRHRRRHGGAGIDIRRHSDVPPQATVPPRAGQ